MPTSVAILRLRSADRLVSHCWRTKKYGSEVMRRAFYQHCIIDEARKEHISYIYTHWNCKFKICLEYSYSYPILHSLQALIGACWLPLLACWLSCWFVGFLRSHFGSSVLSTADRPFTVSTSSKMDDTPKQMCKASRTILQQLTHVLQEEVVKSLQHWTYLSWRLIASLQMEARSQLVQAFKKRPDLSHWRSIMEKLNRKYLFRPFQIGLARHDADA